MSLRVGDSWAGSAAAALPPSPLGSSPSVLVVDDLGFQFSSLQLLFSPRWFRLGRRSRHSLRTSGNNGQDEEEEEEEDE